MKKKVAVLVFAFCITLIAFSFTNTKAQSPAQKGQQIFQDKACAACHIINGVGTTVGPDLSDVGSRLDEKFLKDWLRNPQAVKPGTMMPNFNFSEEELEAIVAYLLTLKGAQMQPTPQAETPAPEGFKDTKNPIVASSESINLGKADYEQLCTSCHGASGRGDGLAASGIVPKPTDFTNKGFMETRTDGQFFYSITYGVKDSAMPSWGDKLSAERRWNIINYIRTFSKQEGEAEIPDLSHLGINLRAYFLGIIGISVLLILLFITYFLLKEEF